MVKARFETQCARCTEWVRVGEQVEHAYGGYWHKSCIASYHRYRANQITQLVASAKTSRSEDRPTRSR